MGKHIVGWIIATLIVIFVLPLVLSPTAYVNQVKREQAALIDSFGDDSAQKIIAASDHTYSVIFEETGFHDSFMQRNKIPEQDILNNAPIPEDPLAPNATAKYERKMQSYFVSLFISFYEWIFRLTQLLMWGAFAFPFLLAAIWDGLAQRKIRSATFVYSHPALYNGLWHGLIAVIFSANLLFNLPFTVKPLIYPILIAIVALLIRTLISNLQRSA